MNFDAIEADIKALEKASTELNITNTEEFEKAKYFSQSLSSINLWITHLQESILKANKLVASKMDKYDRQPKQAAATPPPENACIACNGTGKATNGSTCSPCKGTGKKTLEASSVPQAPTSSPSKQPEKPPVAAPKPSISLDDFDEGPVSDEEQLEAELQKTLF